MIFMQSLSFKAVIDRHEKKITIEILDQTKLPHQEKWITIHDEIEMIEAIKSLRVRGAPLIGIAASFMIAKLSYTNLSKEKLLVIANELYEARPTAVNLMICVDRMKKIIQSSGNLIDEAIHIFQEDVALCQQIAEHGSSLIEDGDQILTHCNTGGLATAGIGTAIGILNHAHLCGKKFHVYIDETRPLLQGGRLTAWELNKLGIDCTLITDSMAAFLMSQGKINKAIVGSDRIAINGDFANKIGTYSVAVNCHYHQIPFIVAAPYTTIDFHCPSGRDIPIEERNGEEVRSTWAPKNTHVYNPAFDITPATLTTYWVLDTGIYNQKTITEATKF